MQRATPNIRAKVARAVAKHELPTGRSRKKVLAYINHGRWVADCLCNGSELVTEGEDMLCGSCGTTSPVEFPTDMAQIEELLDAREAPIFQNWLPGESVDEILAQNIDQGILPDDLRSR